MTQAANNWPEVWIDVNDDNAFAWGFPKQNKSGTRIRYVPATDEYNADPDIDDLIAAAKLAYRFCDLPIDPMELSQEEMRLFVLLSRLAQAETVEESP